MRTTFLFLVFLGAFGLLGCSAPPPDFSTCYGSAVYLNQFTDWISPDQACQLQTELLADLRDPHCAPTMNCAVDPLLGDAGAENSLHWVNYEIEKFPVPCAYGHCAGYQQEHELVIGAVPVGPASDGYSGGGPRMSAFKHETIHYLQEFRLGVYDPNHTRPEWLFQ